MYKALIVDDEQPARRAIRALGQWERHGISEIYEADNGERGLELLASYEPDLVFVDMRMPQLGGAEFLARCAALSRCRCIVISGFDDFAYTRSAIQSGAVDYLLKPIKGKELNQAIAKAMEQVGREQAQRQRELASAIARNVSMPLVKEKIFASMLEPYGKLHRMEELAAFVGAKQGGTFAVVVMVALNVGEVCEGRFHGDVHACYYALTNALNELLSGLGEAFSFKSGKDEQELVAVISAERGWDVPGAVRGAVEHAIAGLRSVFGFDCIASFGVASPGVEQLDGCYQAARAALNKADLLHPQPVQTGEASGPPQTPGPFPAPTPAPAIVPKSIRAKRELLLHALDSGSAAAAAGVLRHYFAELRQSGRFSAEMMAKSVAEFRALLEEAAQHASVSAPVTLSGFDVRFRYPLMRFEAYEERMLQFCEQLFVQLTALNKPGEGGFNIDKVKEYIDLHFYEDLTIAFLTERFYLSKEHLHRLFKHKFGTGIHEYALKLRMEKAKELLRDADLKIQTVCEKVGFHDHNYFSKAFKKHCGVSPLEYRQSVVARQNPAPL